MELTVDRLGAVVVDALRVAGYMESTIGQYGKSIRYLSAFAADRGGVYSPALGAEFAAGTTSPRTGRFSAQRRFDYRRLVWLIDGYLATGSVDVSLRGRGGGGPRAMRRVVWAPLTYMWVKTLFARLVVSQLVTGEEWGDDGWYRVYGGGDPRVRA